MLILKTDVLLRVLAPSSFLSFLFFSFLKEKLSPHFMSPTVVVLASED